MMARRAVFFAAAFGLAAGAMFIAQNPALAQAECDDPKIIERLPNNCQIERISASGNQRPTRIWALSSARDHWQDQVLNKYGERYARWSRAACLKEECVPASLGGFKRCTLTGYPCLTKPTPNELLTLSRDEIRQMQRFLNRFGAKPRLVLDGKFGRSTTSALEAWQRLADYKVDGLPTRENLDRLRQHRRTTGSTDGGLQRLTRTEIREMQRRLNQFGYGLKVDGYFGRSSRRALRRFQRRHALPARGKATRRALRQLRRRTA
ncbi:MAG: peptidoglycan-binding protein [Hyphomicrobiaceae bacterium]